MPVRIRLATKGARRKLRVSMWYQGVSFGFRESGAQQVYIVIEQLEIIRDLLDAAYHGHENRYRAAGSLCDGVGRAQIKPRLYQNQLDAVAFHGVDDVERVGRRGRDSRLGLDVVDD